MPARPYLVLPNHECVPLEGEYRIECHFDQWWVLGHHRAIGCDSEHHARGTLERLMQSFDAHDLAAEALADLPENYGVVGARA